MVGSSFTKRYANKTWRQFYAKNIVSEYRGGGAVGAANKAAR